MAHYSYCSAPSKLNKKQLYEEYIKLVEHSKKNDFIVSCSESNTGRKHKEAMYNMIEKQKEVIKCAEERIEYYEGIVKDLEKENEQFKECAMKIRKELSESSDENE